mmetsp:Transcript_109743/g.234493  ORF Transcript_109743/g.234493 Transcript_109743/m.234493 type:complete len:237 (-) Transcript_109743:347-1057(-)
MAHHASHKEGRCAVLHHTARVGTGGSQDSHHLEMAALSRRDERGHAVGFCEGVVGISALAKEALYQSHVAAERRFQELAPHLGLQRHAHKLQLYRTLQLPQRGAVLQNPLRGVDEPRGVRGDAQMAPEATLHVAHSLLLLYPQRGQHLTTEIPHLHLHLALPRRALLRLHIYIELQVLVGGIGPSAPRPEMALLDETVPMEAAPVASGPVDVGLKVADLRLVPVLQPTLAGVPQAI